ncbi:hypothetical protein POV27_14915 [Aureisphaera galaxeae]|uniref:CIS tube protein n=1 Tax=Aureisphaera galaxeae TaxID=1538023 RepID=UPI002350EE3A|nr:hypothetical protein [Aureisphaera galaxeae]MDC8005352.1 hypothetical protein [Aureisphaera galaxeae]
MIEGLLGIIDKMRIEVYPNDEYNEAEAISTIFVQVNPESYTMNHQVEFCEGQAMGASSQNLKFNKIGAEEVTFDFIFDSSGVLPPAKIEAGKVEKLPLLDSLVDVLKPAIANPFEEAATVEEELEQFKDLLLGYNGDTHETRYLQLLWGGFEMKCRLMSMQIEYKVFRRDGRPIRANAQCKFKGTQSYKEMQAEQNQQSPDVTHKKVVKLQDKFTLLAEQTYNQNKYYIDVAKANGLLSFRKLETGQTLLFPPVK